MPCPPIPPPQRLEEDDSELRNQVIYGEGPSVTEQAMPSPMPSLTKPQLAVLSEKECQPASAPALSQIEQHSEPPPASRRVPGLPMPVDAFESQEADPPLPTASSRPLPEAKLDDAKTMYVVSDIVDALRADAGYKPLPPPPGRERPSDRPSLWQRISAWMQRLRATKAKT